VTIADVEKQQRPEIAHAMHPSEQDGILADVHRSQSATGVSTSEGS